jgi:hypothetical protein
MVGGSTASGYNPVQRFTFANGTVWNLATIVSKIGPASTEAAAFGDFALEAGFGSAMHERQTQLLVNAMATFQSDGAMETTPHMRTMPWQRSEMYLLSS